MSVSSHSYPGRSAAGFSTSAARLRSAEPQAGTSAARLRSAASSAAGFGPQAEALMVKTLNQIFYDVEAEVYDERHPEVIEGDAEWWSSRGGALVRELKSGLPSGSGLTVLDVGCGTGFVSSLLSNHLAEGDLMVGLDHSEGMLKRARSKLAGKRVSLCRFARGDAASLQFLDHSFHMLTVNSFLHHVYDYRSVLNEIDRVLKPGGYLLLAHEPNKEFFQSPFIRMAASAWKLIGFGMKVPQDICDKINSRLRESRLAASEVRPDDILRLVEYHSPVEQGPVRIDKTKGFSLRDLLDQELRGYALIELNEYSTFYHRSLLERHPGLMRVAKTAASLLNGKGNLFSAILRKKLA
jgi:ubiquinone/menaquinone biosynthesis C-methylase UbiE